MNFGTFGYPKGLNFNSGLLGIPISNTLWTPNYLNTFLWLDAADSSTITLVSGNVSQWNDKSKNAAHCLQSDTTKQPLFVANAVENNSGVRFNGSSTFLQNTTRQFPLIDRAFYLVFKERIAINNAGAFIITPIGGNDYEQTTALVASPSNHTTAQFIITGSISSSYALLKTSSVTSPCSLGIYQEIKIGSSSTGYLDGISFATDTSFTEFSSLSGGGYLLGSRYISGAVTPNTFILDGDIYEIIYLDYIPDNEINFKIQGYLAWKWGLTSNLPISHPYKNSPPLYVY